MIPTQNEIISHAVKNIKKLSGHTIDLIQVGRPTSIAFALQLVKIISKLSPIIGNLLEFNIVDYLNDDNRYSHLGNWIRQDPGFPDALFYSNKVIPNPGIEIKAWFPLATEMTGRFKESQKTFINMRCNLCIIAWLPEFLIYGKPKIIDICSIACREVAKSRDLHYSNPPDYIILEPEDTKIRTRNLQQTNTVGFKIQENDKREIDNAYRLVSCWKLPKYSPELFYQKKMKELLKNYNYRVDTNYAKIDRIENIKIEKFKTKIINSAYYGKPLKEWASIFRIEGEAEESLANYLNF